MFSVGTGKFDKIIIIIGVFGIIASLASTGLILQSIDDLRHMVKQK